MERLTKRERQVAALIAKGHTNAAIARELRIAKQTVKHHVRTLFIKTGVGTRVQLARVIAENVRHSEVRRWLEKS